jgi:hypothetical protein
MFAWFPCTTLLVYTDPLDAKKWAAFNQFVRQDLTNIKPKTVNNLTQADRYKQAI